MKKALDVVTVGEALALFIAETPGPLHAVSRFARAPAGAELNVAVGLSRLGLRTGYISALGQDNLGDDLLSFMHSEGIDCTHVVRDTANPTGLMFKTRQQDSSDPVTEYFRRGSAASRLAITPDVLDYAAQARHLHVSGVAVAVSESLRELVFALAEQAGKLGQTVSFDPNLRPSLWPNEAEMVKTLNALATRVDMVMPGLAEGRLLTGHTAPRSIADFYLDRGAKHVVIKLGAEGAYAADRFGHVQVPGLRVPRVADTVGAGDGFAAGVISGLLNDLSLAEATRRGNAIGARVVQFPGDSDGLPHRHELIQMMEALDAHG